MKKIINSASLISNVFYTLRYLNEFPSSDLNPIANSLEKRLNGFDIFIEHSKSSFMEAIDIYGDLFQMKDGKLYKTGIWKDEEYKFVEEEFNYWFPEEVSKIIKDTIKENIV